MRNLKVLILNKFRFLNFDILNFFQNFCVPCSVSRGTCSVSHVPCSVSRETRPHRTSQRGFTLVEVVMSLIILTVIAGATGPLLAVTVDGIILHLDRVGLEQSADLALSRMSRETRRLRNDASVVSATGTEFEFVDIDNNQIRYRQVGSSLVRRQGAGSDRALADGIPVTGLSFTYLNESGAAIGSPVTGLGTDTDIRKIRIQISLQDGSHTLVVQTDVRPRNLKHDSFYLA